MATLDKRSIPIPGRTKQDSVRLQCAIQWAHSLKDIVYGLLKYYCWKQLIVGNHNSREKSCVEGRTSVESEYLTESGFISKQRKAPRPKHGPFQPSKSNGMCSALCEDTRRVC